MKTKGLFNHAILWVLVIIALGPLFLLMSNSLKTQADLGLNPLGLPSSPQWSNYSKAWEQGNFRVTMTNSLFLVVTTVTGVLVLGGAAAYALARFKPRGSEIYMVYTLTLSTVPFWLYAIPLFILWRDLRLLNTLHGLVLIYIAMKSPFAIFLLRSFLLGFPDDLADAARVDGANEAQILTKIVAPIVWPGFLTTGLVVTLNVWSEFQVAVIFLQDDKLLPVTTSYFRFQERFGADLPLTAAGAVMMIIPVLVAFLLLQKTFIEGLTQGSVK
jgi:raffinose/stachyose/melibiose transport system permease protein